MNERRIESVNSFPIGMFFWWLVFVASVAAGMVFGNRHFLVFALAPGLLAMGLWFTRIRKIAFDITEDGLHVESPPLEISFDSIESISLNGRPQDFRAPKLKPGPLTIVHDRGYLQIPAALSVPVADLYRFLGAKVPLSGKDGVSPELAAHYQNEIAVFGADRVFSYSARHLGSYGSSRRRLKVCLCLMMICGVIWAVCGGTFFATPRDISPWLPLGIMFTIFSGLFWLVAATGSTGFRFRNRLKNASLIISPSGIALRQGDLKGQLLWNELRDIRYRAKARNFVISYETDISSLPGIQLIVPGVTIDIPDVYNRPLPLIHGLLLRYWRGDEPKLEAPAPQSDD
jgi:hypothetical protein